MCQIIVTVDSAVCVEAGMCVEFPPVVFTLDEERQASVMQAGRYGGR